MTDQLLGRSIDRLEDERFVQGHGRYVDDLAAPNALIGIVVAQVEPDGLRLSDWLMSCRVLKRGVEDYLMNHVVNLARERGLRWIRGQYIPTSKNAMVKDFYAQFGFETTDQLNWVLDTHAYLPRENFISAAV